MSELINWSKVSMLLSGTRTNIRKDYDGKKYKRKIDRLKKIVDTWERWITSN